MTNILNRYRDVQDLSCKEVENLRLEKAVLLEEQEFSGTFISYQLGMQPRSYKSFMNKRDKLLYDLQDQGKTISQMASTLGVDEEIIKLRLVQIEIIKDMVRKPRSEEPDRVKFISSMSQYLGFELGFWLARQPTNFSNTHLGFLLGINREDMSLTLRGEFELSLKQAMEACKLINLDFLEVCQEKIDV